MDILTKPERSQRMSLIRSKWTKPERWMHDYLKGNKIKHKMYPDIRGSPDIIIPDKKIAIFLHGCFWHKCPLHYKEPSNNKMFWRNKVVSNINRDKKNELFLRKNGWKVIKIWEHEVHRNKPRDSIRKIIRELQDA